MRILPEVIIFEWDKGNRDKNVLKHRITNKEAEEVFFNKPNFILDDVKHSLSERRHMIWGITDKKRKLSIFFTMRKDEIRIISVRDMHKKERREYEKQVQENTKI